MPAAREAADCFTAALIMSRFRILFETLPAPGACVAVPPDQAHHLARVRRLAVGDAVECIDRAGARCPGTIAALDAGGVTVRADAAAQILAPAGVRLTVVAAMLPENRFDYLLQKCTEIGVAACQPIVAERSVVREHRAAIARKVARWQRICDEAARQCGGAPMRVQTPLGFDAAVRLPYAWRVIADREGEPFDACLSAAPAADDAAVMIGPEGGFTPTETAVAVEHAWQRARFHVNILRAETAAVVCCALLQHALTAHAQPQEL